MSSPRIALFTDSFHEANGVARTGRALESYAARHDLPFLCVHAGEQTRVFQNGSVTRVELRRGGLGSFGLEHDLRFDVFLWRYTRLVSQALRSFAPDILHFTGPSDIGQLGAYLGYRMDIPMVGSWHTNLHEYASRRLLTRCRWLSEKGRMAMRLWVERRALSATLLFYRIPRAIFAPNDELHRLLERRLGKPTYDMSRGVDTTLFTPARRRRDDGTINIGFVGRLSPEKNVRALADVDRALAATATPFRMTIVGEGSEAAWLRTHLPHASFPGVLRGDALADAYADMDLFVFPSETETVGNVVLEAMASGVPVVAMARGGPRFIAADAASAVLANNTAGLIDAAVMLARDDARRRRMAEAARAQALRRSWDSVFAGVYDVYRRVAAQRQRDDLDAVAHAAGTPAA
ncbi:MAG TPA: glycosyltransferase [Vicinamibacterales bacterium]|jgi:glycosyltransferase involved in cell wall biosynthesis|nr:glycosyltransferase [Vicinamibacterales bacterium]